MLMDPAGYKFAYGEKDLYMLQDEGTFIWEGLIDGGDSGWELESSGGLFILHLATDVSYWLGPQLGLSIEASPCGLDFLIT